MRAAMKRIFRFGLAAMLVTAIAVPALTGSAFAKGKPAKVTLTCPTGESASGTVTLLPDIFSSSTASDPTPISCSSGQTSTVSIHPTSQPAAAFDYSISVTGTQSGGCFGRGTRSNNPIDCFAGVTLTVR